MHQQIFFFSTGRCGTQWIDEQFRKHYADLLHVEHEPAEYLSFGDSVPAISNNWLKETSLPDSLVEHFEYIRRISESTDYLESGFPAWKAIPAISGILGENVRIVHLIRHPVTTAYSWMSTGAYAPPLLPHLPIREIIKPSDDGARYAHYSDRWDRMTPYEKNLYYWLELNACGLDLEKTSTAPWMQLKFEELFFGDGLKKLLEFLNLPLREEILDSVRENIDKYRPLPTHPENPALIHNHPEVCALAGQLGYDVEDVDMEAFKKRFFPFGL